jgi:hypothetical protein
MGVVGWWVVVCCWLLVVVPPTPAMVLPGTLKGKPFPRPKQFSKH